MGLSETLLGLGKDYGFLAGSGVADEISTYFAVRKFGIEGESHNDLREKMRREGIAKPLIKHGLSWIAATPVAIASLYLLDAGFKIEDRPINLHNLYCYGMGSIRYLAAASNFLLIGGFEKTRKVVLAPVRAYLNLTNSLFRLDSHRKI